MAKDLVRLLVVIAIVVIAVVVTMALLNKPNYNTYAFNVWQKASQNSRYNIVEKVNTKYNSRNSHNGKTLVEEEDSIKVISLIQDAIDKNIVYLVKLSNYSKDVQEDDVKALGEKLNEYYNLRVNDGETGYYIDYLYNYIQNNNDQNILAYFDMVVTIKAKWDKMSKTGVNLLPELKTFVSKFSFDGKLPTDLKTILLDFESQVASNFLLSENYNDYVTEHFAELNNLYKKLNKKFNQIISYTDNDLELTRGYYSLTDDELKNFITKSGSERSEYISSFEDTSKKKVLQVLNSYLEVS